MENDKTHQLAVEKREYLSQINFVSKPRVIALYLPCHKGWNVFIQNISFHFYSTSPGKIEGLYHPYKKNPCDQRVKLRIEHAFQEKKHGFTPIFHALYAFLRVVGEISHRQHVYV